MYIKKCLREFFRLHDYRYFLYSLILFVTSKCNGNCPGCLYSHKLNENNDLTLQEIKEISRKIGPIKYLQISGGEPFLRTDLPDICRTFVRNNETKMVIIPTNGLMPKRIEELTKEILKYVNCDVGIGVSVDGTEKINSYHRGSPVAFKKALKTYEKLQSLGKFHQNMGIRFSSRMTNYNAENLIKLNKLLMRKYKNCSHSITPIRGEINGELKKPTPLQYVETMNKIRGSNSLFLDARIKFVANLLKNREWPFRCLAGEKIGVIDSDGEVRLCELLESIGNLRDNNYKFHSIWNNKKAKEQFKQINGGKCSSGCTHGCFLEPSAINNPYNLLKIIRSGKSFP